MRYQYKDTEMTHDQWRLLGPSIGRMETAVNAQSIGHGDRAPDKEFLQSCAVIHVELFHGPRPNINSGAGILFMFKQLILKYRQLEKLCKYPAAAPSDGRVDRTTEDGTLHAGKGVAGPAADPKAGEVRNVPDSRSGTQHPPRSNGRLPGRVLR